MSRAVAFITALTATIAFSGCLISFPSGRTTRLESHSPVQLAEDTTGHAELNIDSTTELNRQTDAIAVKRNTREKIKEVVSDAAVTVCLIPAMAGALTFSGVVWLLTGQIPIL